MMFVIAIKTEEDKMMEIHIMSMRVAEFEVSIQFLCPRVFMMLRNSTTKIYNLEGTDIIYYVAIHTIILIWETYILALYITNTQQKFCSGYKNDTRVGFFGSIRPLRLSTFQRGNLLLSTAEKHGEV